jgi:hypothetical protein
MLPKLPIGFLSHPLGYALLDFWLAILLLRMWTIQKTRTSCLSVALLPSLENFAILACHLLPIAEHVFAQHNTTGAGLNC